MNNTVMFEMNPVKRIQMLFSWSEFYFANKRKEQYDKVNKEISILHKEIIKQNLNIKSA